MKSGESVPDGEAGWRVTEIEALLLQIAIII